jgi:hypothetical protein
MPVRVAAVFRAQLALADRTRQCLGGRWATPSIRKRQVAYPTWLLVGCNRILSEPLPICSSGPSRPTMIVVVVVIVFDRRQALRRQQQSRASVSGAVRSRHGRPRDVRPPVRLGSGELLRRCDHRRARCRQSSACRTSPRRRRCFPAADVHRCCHPWTCAVNRNGPSCRRLKDASSPRGQPLARA